MHLWWAARRRNARNVYWFWLKRVLKFHQSDCIVGASHYHPASIAHWEPTGLLLRYCLLACNVLHMRLLLFAFRKSHASASNLVRKSEKCTSYMIITAHKGIVFDALRCTRLVWKIRVNSRSNQTHILKWCARFPTCNQRKQTFCSILTPPPPLPHISNLLNSAVSNYNKFGADFRPNLPALLI